jgi:hypothetical protein
MAHEGCGKATHGAYAYGALGIIIMNALLSSTHHARRAISAVALCLFTCCVILLFGRHNVLLLQGGWDTDGVFTPGWDAFAGFFEATAKRLGACRSRQLGPGGVRVIGPGWDNVRRGAQQHQLTVHVNCTPAQYWWEHRSAVVDASP